MKNLNMLSALIGLTLVASSVEIAPREKQPVTIGFTQAFAGPTGNALCDTLLADAQAAVPPYGKYANPALGLFHSELYRFNRLETADVELVFCRLSKVLGVDPNLAQLPQTVERNDPKGHKVSVTVSVPTESFATANGYLAKAVINWDDAPFLTMWWAGSATASKGYLILGDNPMIADGMTRLRYVQWDRSGGVQSVKFFGTQYATSFLTSVLGSSGTQSGGDRITYGRASYDTTTKAVTGQAVQIRAVPPGTSFGCIKTAFNGTLDGSMDVFRPAGGTWDAVSDTNTDGTHMDGMSGVIDSTTTTTGGTVIAEPATLPEPLDYSCADLDGADATGKAFAGGNVDYTADPAVIFPH